MKKFKECLSNVKKKLKSTFIRVNLKNKLEKVVVGVLSCTGLTLVGGNVALAAPNMSGGLTTAKTTVLAQIKPVVNDVIVPFLLLGLGVFLIFLIVKSVTSYREGNGINALPLIVTIVAIIVIGTFPSWGWTAIGV